MLIHNDKGNATNQNDRRSPLTMAAVISSYTMKEVISRQRWVSPLTKTEVILWLIYKNDDIIINNHR